MTSSPSARAPRLPRTVHFPDLDRFLRESPGLAPYFGSVRAILQAVPEIEIVPDPDLERPWGDGLPLRVDGELVVVDVSDWIDLEAPRYRNLNPPLEAYPLVLRMQYVEWMRSRPNLGHFPQMSFYDWARFEQLAGEIQYDPFRNDRVLHIQQYEWDRGGDGPALRRDAVRWRLQSELGSRLDDGWETDQEAYWRKAARCLVSVHVPGSWNHMLDRGQLQMMAFGVCTISPELFSYVLTEPPTAGLHYVACRDDFSDLFEKVAWCDSNRDLCARIGASAAAFFRSHAMPRPAWESIRGRLDALGV